MEHIDFYKIESSIKSEIFYKTPTNQDKVWFKMLYLFTIMNINKQKEANLYIIAYTKSQEEEKYKK